MCITSMLTECSVRVLSECTIRLLSEYTVTDYQNYSKSVIRMVPLYRRLSQHYLFRITVFWGQQGVHFRGSEEVHIQRTEIVELLVGQPEGERPLKYI